MTVRTHSFSFSGIIKIIIPIAVCLVVGSLAGYLQQSAVQNWYPHLNKPLLTPPNAIFPIAWTILYVFMGLSIGLIYLTDSDEKPALRQPVHFPVIPEFSVEHDLFRPAEHYGRPDLYRPA